ncbi:type II toxin-antitoxin system VapB family antitoxin [Bradyrhizobium iriomotense]|uniref:Histidinol dehydrogenase n=1 Tax=Bradyrhizobium iriomotense TaxID=441950 RepID=A0ABQ6AZZ2_9BRAD|nr:type II toxin-antitoxin system VapB family antitoxin [Bradyrhizobium iriomotense]GLR87717.1 histidinol dehydrogenase [Bradyrhizobium iriomotense]
MPLFIRDDQVDALASRLQAMTGLRTKTEAVRLALEHEIKRQTEDMLPSQRIGKALAIVAGIRADAAERGLVGTDDFDMKAFTDEMWGV